MLCFISKCTLSFQIIKKVNTASLSLKILSFGIDTEVYYILNVIVKHQWLLERKGEKNSKLNLVTEAEKKKDQL